MSETPILGGGPELDVNQVIQGMEDALVLEGIAAATEAAATTEVFGSQLMGKFEGSDAQPFMSGGPTWTGTGNSQDGDDGDTGPGSEN